MPNIYIHNLGPVKECKMELEDFCVLTGPQASGKSTIAKAIYFFRTIKDDCIALYIKNQTIGEVEGSFSDLLIKQLRSKFMQIFGSSWGMSMDMKLRYEYKEGTYVEVSLRKTQQEGLPNYIYFEFSNDIKEYLYVLNRGDQNRERLIRYSTSLLFADYGEVIYIPAGRSMITLLTTQLNYIFLMLDDAQKRALDYCTQNYMERILRLKPQFAEGIQGMYYNKINTSAEKLNKPVLKAMMEFIPQILKGRYQYTDGEERLLLDSHRYVKLNYTSSGQQEVVWILNLLFYYVLENKHVYMILEEPESHLYPEAQSQVAEMLAMFLKAGNKMLLTTHSPYILGALNNLLYAGNLKNKGKAEVGTLIREEMQIDSEKTAAYFVKEGQLENIIDEELSMINHSVIDGISLTINEMNDKLIDLDLGD